jgi:integrase/recombinase XerD
MARIAVELFKGKKYNDGSYPVMIRVAAKSAKRYIYCGFSVLPKDWDKRSNLPLDPVLRSTISAKLTAALNVLCEIEKKGNYTLDQLVSGIKIQGSNITFYQFAEKVIQSERKAGKIGNAESFKTLLNVVKDFTRDKDFKFEDIDYKWLKDFELYHYSKRKSVGSLSIYLRTIRSLYNKAISENVCDVSSYPFGRRYRIPTAPKRKIAISKQDINKIRQLDLPEYGSLWDTRNYFEFMFGGRGMNFVDMAQLKLKDIQNGRIYYVRQKTKYRSKKSLSVAITPKMQKIINLYQEDKKDSDYLFNIVSRKRPQNIRKDIKNGLKSFNKYFKRLGEMAGLERKDLTSYSIRHSWGTIAKRLGYPIAPISDGYGHSGMSVTETYLAEIEDEALDKMNQEITR